MAASAVQLAAALLAYVSCGNAAPAGDHDPPLDRFEALRNEVDDLRALSSRTQQMLQNEVNDLRARVSALEQERGQGSATGSFMERMRAAMQFISVLDEPTNDKLMNRLLLLLTLMFTISIIVSLAQLFLLHPWGAGERAFMAWLLAAEERVLRRRWERCRAALAVAADKAAAEAFIPELIKHLSVLCPVVAEKYPLHAAVMAGSPEATESLLRNHRSTDPNQIITARCAHGQHRVFGVLFRTDFMSPLHLATALPASDTAARIVGALVRHGANVDAFDKRDGEYRRREYRFCKSVSFSLPGMKYEREPFNRRPLAVALLRGNLPAAGALLRAGADMHLHDLDYNLFQYEEPRRDYLTKCAALRSFKSMPPVMVAAVSKHGRSQALKLLQEHGLDFNRRYSATSKQFMPPPSAATALHLSAANLDAVKALLCLGANRGPGTGLADPSVTDNFGRTPAQLAEDTHPEAAGLLRAAQRWRAASPVLSFFHHLYKAHGVGRSDRVNRDLLCHVISFHAQPVE